MLADESRLCIFSDGQKTEDDKAKVKQAKQLANQVTENLGLINAIINGLTQLVNEYGQRGDYVL